MKILFSHKSDKSAKKKIQHIYDIHVLLENNVVIFFVTKILTVP